MMARQSSSKILQDDQPGNGAWDRDEFLAMISHEIRNSTQSIISWVEFLCLRAPADETLKQGLEVIRRNGRLQIRLLNQLLAFSRRQDGDLWLDTSRIALAPILELAINTMTPQALAKRIQLHAELEPANLPVIGDAAQLEEIFTNLLSNAIKFTPAGGHIEFRLRRAKGCAEVTVSDSGRGISAEFLPHVFDRFRREKRSPAEPYGLGLGLAIVHYLVERHHGKISAISPGEGKGATFKVCFPLAPNVAAAPSPAAARTTSVPSQLSE
jgi:signal transduction histidine kinase